LEVSLSLGAAEMQAGDPLFVQVLLKNRGAQPIRWQMAPDFARGFRVVVRRVGAEHYIRTTSKDIDIDSVRAPFHLEPQASLFAIDVLLAEINPFLLEPDRYELRAEVTDPKRVNLAQPLAFSEPLLLTVVPRAEAELKLISRYRQEIRYGVSATHCGTLERTAEDLRRLEDQLGPSVLKTTLVWSRMVNDYDPNAPMAAARLEAMQNVRLIVSPVTADAIGLCLASRLVAIKQPEAALKALKTIKGFNLHAEGLRSDSQSRIDRREKARREKAQD
jgi:hypothetical protein